MRYYCEEGREALEALESSENGLSDAEAQKRLEKNGRAENGYKNKKHNQNCKNGCKKLYSYSAHLDF